METQSPDKIPIPPEYLKIPLILGRSSFNDELLQKEAIKEEIKQFYSKYIDKVTCAYRKDIETDNEGIERCYAKRTKKREEYLFKGLNEDVVLIECPLDLLAIEFEKHTNKKDDNREASKEQIIDWLIQTYENAKKYNFDCCVCDHGGTSPYLYLANLENLIENKEEECKKEIAKLLIPKEAIDFLDLSNLGKTLIPIIERPHWKFNKYKGAIHKIVEGKTPLEHKNKCPDIILQKIFDAAKNNILPSKKYGEGDINRIPINSVISTIGLKKNGGEYHGINPWHGSEKTKNNFYLNPDKNVWYCFRCKSGGGIAQAIALNEGIMKSCEEKLTTSQFIEVVKIAKDKYGLKPLEKQEPNNQTTIENNKPSSMKDFLSGKEKKERPILKPFIPERSIVTIFGEPASLKSILGDYIAACVSTGKKFLDRYPLKKRATLILSTENSERTDKKRLKAIFKGMKVNPKRRETKNLRLFICGRRQISLFSDKNYFEKLKENIQQHKVKLLVIDTLSPMMRELNDNNAGEVVTIFNDYLFPLIDEFGLSILIIMHSQKSGKDFLGSVKYKASCDSFFEALRDSEDNSILSLLCHKSREGENNIKMRVGFETKKDLLHKINFTFLEEYSGKQSPKNKNNNPAKEEQVKEIIIGFLQDNEAKYGEIVKYCLSNGLAIATIKRTINKLYEAKKIKKKQGKEGGYYIP